MLRLSLLDASVVGPALAPGLLLLLAVGAVLLGRFGVGDAALFEAACSADVLLDPAVLFASFLTPSLHEQHVFYLGTHILPLCSRRPASSYDPQVHIYTVQHGMRWSGEDRPHSAACRHGRSMAKVICVILLKLTDVAARTSNASLQRCCPCRVLCATDFVLLGVLWKA